jgi:hypothetical protein
MPGRKSLKPLRFRSRAAARPFGGKNGRGEVRGEKPRLGFFGRESPKGLEAQESTRPRPGVSTQGSRRGHGFFGGIKPPKAPLPGREGLAGKSRGGKRGRETFFPITGEDESSEGRSPRASGAERGFHGSGGADTAGRVAKP